MIVVGTRWVYRGRVVNVTERKPDNIEGRFLVLAVPERTPERMRELKLKAGQHHWTDWLPERTLESRGEPIPEGSNIVIEPEGARGYAATQREAAEKATEEVRSEKKRRPLDTGQRLKNRINTAKHKLRHPEKHGRTKWTKMEQAEIEAVIAAAQADLAASKGGKA